MKNKLYNILKDRNLSALILSDGYNIHYLTGYKGHTGCMVYVNGKTYIITDSRYTEQVTIEAGDVICVDVERKGYSTTVKEILDDNLKSASNSKNKFKIGFENKHISYESYKAYLEKLSDCYELCELDESVNLLRQVKSKEEIECIAEAEKIGDEAFSYIVKYITDNDDITEKDVAYELENYMKKNGADNLSFDTIVASGTNSSLPHAVPTDKKLESGDFVTMDFGCIYKGYCSDMTRTIVYGDEISEKQELVYNTVLKAQLAALEAIKPGVKCSDVDALARNIIKEAGFGDYFGHGLGHSVGLFIHEEPRLSPSCDTILEEGMLVTVEPGIYLPKEFGVRIEDLVVVTKDGYRNLASSSKNLIKLTN